VAGVLLGFVEPEIKSKLHVKNTIKTDFTRHTHTHSHFNHSFVNSHLLIPFLLHLNINPNLCLPNPQTSFTLKCMIQHKLMVGWFVSLLVGWIVSYLAS
jgi:hypothetical protein